ncbi:Aldo/keto reductase [Cyberlindnera jadinii NRRL Y-1542]|uniref:Aldo/keto reductase n=1 Tax=Cyberlindnera jadinii (strain ATCC 18201 / CBS 1600 / BCRC 20928 / JCM 3617 / NBRC 0987 / NRRL Y-1542) TaxID=983966 RepID=A0A1E4S8J6_CYBJN|nr:Aldo/keto reductase [Cyberlindnera jadinii NRRL Y-1542]ODV75722.1 Aldo/keto reductase [Cyberlindnera jadinii NRRL Y-1542]
MVATKKSDLIVTLNNGAKIPQLGFGTYLAENDDAYTSVLHALKSGYTHIDTASIYENEDQVGKAIKDSGIPREKLFITTKVWPTAADDPAGSLERSLARLGLDYVDLLLIHWPIRLFTRYCKDDSPIDFQIPVKPDGSRDIDMDWSFVKTWELFQQLPTSKVRNIGVSNFSINNLKELLAAPTTTVKPVVNQVELHPLLPQTELLKWCQDNDIYLQAYSPLGSVDSTLFNHPVLTEIAQKYGVSTAQVMINWALSRGYIVLPKSVTPSRIESNLEIFELSPEDVAKVSKISVDEGEKRFVTPNWAPYPVFQ